MNTVMIVCLIDQYSSGNKNVVTLRSASVMIHSMPSPDGNL
jgi:hypothetical protein